MLNKLILKNKKIIIIFLTCILLYLCGFFYYNEIYMMYALDFFVPLTAKIEKINYREDYVIEIEQLTIISLTPKENSYVKRKIENSPNWYHDKIDEELFSFMEYNFDEKFLNKLSNIEDYYWIFYNRNNNIKNRRSINEMWKNQYQNFAIGIYDINNRILYYYEFEM